MWRRALAIFLVAMISSWNPAHAADDMANVAIGAQSIRGDAFPRNAVAYPDGVDAWPDIEFANLVGYRPLLLDLYKPRLIATPLPLIVWVHGGGWNRGDSRASGAISDYPALLAKLAARGYVVASVNYRLSGEAKFPAPLQDINAAILYLKSRASNYGIDASRVFLWGGSAGAHLAALAALTCDDPAYRPQKSAGRLSRAASRAELAPQGSTCVQGGVFWYGAFDLAALGISGRDALFACDAAACPDAYARASPVNRVTRSAPPMLLIHGLADTTVSPQASRDLAARLSSEGVAVDTLFIPGVNHGLLGPTPEATREATLHALRASFAWFDLHAMKSGVASQHQSE